MVSNHAASGPLSNRPDDDMIAHVPRIVDAETDSETFVFSPRVSDDGAPMTQHRRRASLFRNLRTVFCCLAPQALRHGRRFEDGQNSRSSTALSSPVYPSDTVEEFVLGPKQPEDSHKKTLVLDLDETLVHSSFVRVANPAFVIPVDIDGRKVEVFVQKRPGLDHFLQTVCVKFEVVVFTASLEKYANPLLDLLDPEGLVQWRLFREACSVHQGTYVKDLSRLGRELSQTMIVDNSPLSYVFQPSNAIPIGTFLGDPADRDLLTLLPKLAALETSEDVREGIIKRLGVGKTEEEEEGLIAVEQEHVSIPMNQFAKSVANTP